MPDAHAAAVEAMAGALHADSEHGRDGVDLFRKDEPRARCNCWHKALVAADALTTSVAVRAALVAAFEEVLDGIDSTETNHPDGWWETSTGAEFGARKLREAADAILAALAPGEAT